MVLLALRDNDALKVNPPQGDQYLYEGGSNWLWAVSAIFALPSAPFWAARTNTAHRSSCSSF